MPTDKSNHAADSAHDIEAAMAETADQGRRVLNEAIATAERTISEAAKAAERAFREGIDLLRSQTKAYTGDAEQHLDEAQRYVTERVKERPITAVFAGLGVGLLLGLLLSNRSK